MCGGKDANHDVLSMDICGECAPGLKKILLDSRNRIEKKVEEVKKIVKEYENSRSIVNNNTSHIT